MPHHTLTSEQATILRRSIGGVNPADAVGS